MKPEAQRIAIATFLGRDLTAYRFRFQSRVRDTPQWSPAYRTHEEAKEALDEEVRRWHTTVWPVESFVNPGDAPNYPDDLNAMHAAEKVLTDHIHERTAYYGELVNVCNGKRQTLQKWDWPSAGYACAFATAAQRAEAFLRTIGKWKD